jgi:enoyl-CoA hydratase/carnithine racemase
MQLETGTPRVIARKEGAIGELIFNHPERRNALTLDMWQAIPRMVASFAADAEVRVVVLSGAGDKAFVSGADISEFGTLRGDRAADFDYTAQTDAALEALDRLEKPSIAMIRGFCVGGGLAVALACDLRIAADDARFAIPAAKLGLGYSFAGVRTLMHTVGPAYASEELFSARLFDAAEALRMSLVNSVVPVAELESTVRTRAAQIAENAPLTVRASKLAIKQALLDEAERRPAIVDAAVSACFDSQDYSEGRNAFLEKRKPQFQGR